MRMLLILCLISSVISCPAQSSFDGSTLVNVPITVIKLEPEKPLSKKVLKSLKKKYGECFDCSTPSDGDFLDFDLKIDHYRLPDGAAATVFTSEIDNRELSFETGDKLSMSRLRIFARITSVYEKSNGSFEEMIVFANDSENTHGSGTRRSYTKGVILPPNVYKITFVMRDAVNGKIGVRTMRFTVPNLGQLR